MADKNEPDSKIPAQSKNYMPPAQVNKQLGRVVELIAVGQKQEARDILAPMLRYANKNPSFWWQVANAAEGYQQKQTALQKIIELTPKDKRARAALRELERSQNRGLYITWKTLRKLLFVMLIGGGLLVVILFSFIWGEWGTLVSTASIVLGGVIFYNLATQLTWSNLMIVVVYILTWSAYLYVGKIKTIDNIIPLEILIQLIPIAGLAILTLFFTRPAKVPPTKAEANQTKTKDTKTAQSSPVVVKIGSSDHGNQ